MEAIIIVNENPEYGSELTKVKLNKEHNLITLISNHDRLFIEGITNIVKLRDILDEYING